MINKMKLSQVVQKIYRLNYLIHKMENLKLINKCHMIILLCKYNLLNKMKD